jgi:phage tail-like protein
MAQGLQTYDALVGCFFEVDFGFGQDDSKTIFVEVTGMGSEHAVVTQKLMGKNNVQINTHQSGRLKWNELKFKTGITSDKALWQYASDVASGKLANKRLNGTIAMLSQDGKRVAEWHFENAWPKEINGLSFKSDSSDVQFEEMTIVAEYCTRVK